MSLIYLAHCHLPGIPCLKKGKKPQRHFLANHIYNERSLQDDEDVIRTGTCLPLLGTDEKKPGQHFINGPKSGKKVDEKANTEPT